MYGTRVDTVTAADIQDIGANDLASALQNVLGLFIASHRWDFVRPLRTSIGRTVVMLPLLVGTLALTSLGAFLGIRRLRPRRSDLPNRCEFRAELVSAPPYANSRAVQAPDGWYLPDPDVRLG